MQIKIIIFFSSSEKSKKNAILLLIKLLYCTIHDLSIFGIQALI